MTLPWKYIIISLIAGLLLGAAAGMTYSRYQHRRWVKNGPELFLKRLDREVQLTGVQRTQIGALLNADRDKITAFHDQIRKATEVEIRSQLTADQQTRFDAMVARHDAQHKKRDRR
jgi:uncharacterized membrane-anchored protein YhcB (DUF1043 family)